MNFLDSLGLRRKIGLLVAAAVIGVVALATLSSVLARKHIIDSRKAQLVSAVQSAHGIVAGYKADAEAGMFSIEQAQRAAADAVRHARYGGSDGKSDYFYIQKLDGTLVMHGARPEWDGKMMVGKITDGDGKDLITTLNEAIKASADGTAFASVKFPRPGQKEPVPKLQYLVKVDGWDWIVGSGLYMDDVDAQVREAVLTNALIALAILVALGGLGTVLARSVLRQVGGEPSDAMRAMQAVAEGDLELEIPQAPAGSVLGTLHEMVDSLRRMVVEVRQSTDGIQTASVEIATGNTDLSQRTEETASSLQETASSMTQLSGTVRQTADAAVTANQLAQSASTLATKGGSVVSEVVTTMDEITTSSRRIADIIGVIDGIAFQTNILALNAAVEAARAGEQGRGFAVVAGEVRSLAQRSAEAAKEIKALIGTSVDKVEAGARLVADAGSTMSEIVAGVQRVTDIIGEIAAASSEQGQGIEQVNTAVGQLDQMTQQNAALVEQSAAAAESLKEQAIRLAGVVSRFRVGNRKATPAQTTTAASGPVHAASAVAAARPLSAMSTRPAVARTPAGTGSRPSVATAPARTQALASTADDDWETS